MALRLWDSGTITTDRTLLILDADAYINAEEFITSTASSPSSPLDEDAVTRLYWRLYDLPVDEFSVLGLSEIDIDCHPSHITLVSVLAKLEELMGHFVGLEGWILNDVASNTYYIIDFVKTEETQGTTEIAQFRYTYLSDPPHAPGTNELIFNNLLLQRVRDLEQVVVVVSREEVQGHELGGSSVSKIGFDGWIKDDFELIEEAG